ncbi:MAG: DnaA/Hda family protein [Alphaproteobacteria bacterium]|nr:DnaA/Hda family protein [Alphaproteobacteria bacterium]
MVTVCANAKSVLNPDSVKSAIMSRMDSASFDSWIAPLSFSVETNVLNVIAHNQFAADFIKSAYLHIIATVAAEFGLELYLGVGRSPQTMPVIPTNDNVVENKFEPQTSNLKPQTLNFDDFIVSDENNFALTACKKIACGAVAFSPLFIYGPQGSGKTLLTECLNSCGAGRVLMMTGAGFVSEFQRAITMRTVFAFKDFVRDCDTFILDDVQILCGKRATSEEFMTLIIDLAKSGKNVVLTSNVAPAQLSGFDRRMQSVLASGLVVDLVAPNKAVRKNMLTRAGVSGDVAETLSGRIGANGHLVSGVSTKISAWRDIMNADVTVDIAEKLLADCLSKQKTPLSSARAMAARLGISFEDIASKSRRAAVVRARMIMMTALKSATNLSLAEIGRILGDRDHATVLYGLATVEKLKQTDLMIAAEIQQMIEECK